MANANRLSVQRVSSGVRTKLARVADGIEALDAYKSEESFVRHLLPAIRHALLMRQNSFEDELAHLETLNVMIGRAIPDGTLETLNGEKAQLSSMIDGKVALITFWGYS